MPTISQRAVAAALNLPNLDRAADTLAHTVQSVYSAGGPTGQRIKDFLNGKWLGHPLHPALTDVPVGAWTAALGLDLVGERRAGRVAIGIGLLGALGSALSGLTDWLDTSGTPRRLGIAHAALNGAATLLYTSSFFARNRSYRVGVALSMLGYGAVSLAALYGGTMSLDMQIGVNHARATEPPEDEIDLGKVSDITDGGMLRLDAGGYPVLVARRGDEVSAIAALCAHQGGPLDEGTLEGDLVTCPWHGSQFCVRDGSVVHGPSAYPQPAFATRVTNGRIFITAGKRTA